MHEASPIPLIDDDNDDLDHWRTDADGKPAGSCRRRLGRLSIQ